MLRLFTAIGFILAVTVNTSIHAGETIDFDTLIDGEAVTTQFSGLSFTNATALTSGVSLNEFEFPPHSGENVLVDTGGPMTIEFERPIQHIDGYLTYLNPLKIYYYDSAFSLIASTSSSFSNNMALSGDEESSPNERFSFNSTIGIHRLVIEGAIDGNSFALDSISHSPLVSAVPEPSTLLLMLSAFVIIGVRKFEQNIRESCCARP